MSNPDSIYKAAPISGRYITLSEIEPFISSFNSSAISKSVNGLPLYRIEWGHGPLKIFMWSQMHGNESTTTKALFDLLMYLNTRPALSTQISLRVLPMVNPDGAALYTRNNANDVDLNRDALQLTQPESRFLRDEFEEFTPDYAFNLHDQRTMYGIGDKPATVSFLAPSADETRQFNNSRSQAACLIAQIVAKLSLHIPGQIGRYDDAFNPHCTGDAFQAAGVPTTLVEAGHFQEDYHRERTREFVFYALQYAIEAIVDNSECDLKQYHQIPENQKHFFDILIKNTDYRVKGKLHRGDIGVNFKEVLKSQRVSFEPIFVAEGDLSSHRGHHEMMGKKGRVVDYLFNESAHNCL